MERIGQPPTRTRSRWVVGGAAAYWTLNFALLFAEAQWHVLSRLTVWDIVTLKSLIPSSAQLARLIHPH